jgi:hypothetical protein
VVPGKLLFNESGTNPKGSDKLPFFMSEIFAHSIKTIQLIKRKKHGTGKA